MPQSTPAPQPVAPAPQTNKDIVPDGRDGVWRRNFAKFERQGATYSWIIRVPSGQKLYGYSKPREMAEKADKGQLLMDCVRRLARGGYLKPGYSIEFWQNVTDDDRDSILLFTLFSSRYDPQPIIFQTNWLIAFLKNFYAPPVVTYAQTIAPEPGQRQPIPQHVEHKAPPQPREFSTPVDHFYENRWFASWQELIDYCVKLKELGYPGGRIAEYKRKMTDKLERRFGPAPTN